MCTLLTEKLNDDNAESIVKKYDKSPCKGCYLNYLTVYNTRTGKSHKPICKSYKCEKHGWRHANRLRKALGAVLESWKNIAFWNFTLSNKVGESKEDHSKILSKIWRYFVTELRRNKLFSNRETETQYIRVTEMHKSGFIHFHAFFDRYIHHSKIIAIWRRATEVVTGRSEKLSGAYVVGNRRASAVTNYVVKYVTKQANLRIKYANLYSTSGTIILFDQTKAIDAYAVWDSKRKIWLGLRPPHHLLVAHIEHHHILPENGEINGSNLIEIEAGFGKKFKFPE